jgi:beta-lactamase class A
MFFRIVLPCCIFAAVAFAQPTVVDLLERETIAKIERYASQMDGVLGVAAIDLTTGRVFSIKGDSVFPQASSIKIPIMIQMFRAARAGQFRLDDKVTLTKKELVAGSGRLQRYLEKGPVTLTVRELIENMIEFSDNTATNKCISMVGMTKVNGLLDELGLKKTRLRRIMLDSASAARDNENVSTPLEMAHLVEMIYRGKFEDGKEMLEILKTVNAEFRRAIPEDIPVAAKPGSLERVRCETGIVFLPGRPFALSVTSTFLDEQKNPVSDVAWIVFSYFDKLAHSNSYGNRVR